MPIRIEARLTARALRPRIEKLFDLSAHKLLSLEKSWSPDRGTPVFTVRGRYTSRGWTEWTQGFQYGSALLQFDATGDPRFLELARRGIRERMAPHVSHVGVHDHGFNNVSTYGHLRRLMREGKVPWDARELDFCELALKVSGAVQAARWTKTADGGGFIYSFNGPHSLFIDTMRTLRSLALAWQLGHVLMGEQDARISLLRRLLDHALTTAHANVYYGAGRDAYDVPGRVAHEAIFNVSNGVFRCPNSQQGYSPFSTWTRGLAWAILGFAEQLEFLAALPDAAFVEAFEAQGADGKAPAKGRPARRRAQPPGRLWCSPPGWLLPSSGRLEACTTAGQHGAGLRRHGPPAGSPSDFRALFERAAIVTADYYLAQACADGIPMWDTGAPQLHRLGNYQDRPADPFNSWEPVDSSAAAIAAQGLIRLGNYLRASSPSSRANRYRQAGLTIAQTLFAEPYLSLDPRHQGLILHSVYHRPNGWDYVAPGQQVPNGESSMWGDYHARELALLLLREAQGAEYPVFFDRPGR